MARWGAAALAAALPLAAGAQNLQSGYFDDNYLYRFQANPAFGNEGHGFVAMPGLGNLNLGTNGTLGLDNIFYNINGKTTTLLNPNISAAEAMSNIKDKNRLGVSLRETVLAFGFSGMGGYNTFSISGRANVGMSLPGDIFRLAKEGLGNSTYDLSNTLARGMGWAELSLGHSHKINDKLRIGANLKFLMGVASVETDIKAANLQLREDQWIGNVDADIYGYVKGLRYETSWNNDTKRRYVSGVEVDDFSPVNGYGVAVDLGAVYTFNKDWEFSASLLDLGFISWSEGRIASSRGLQSVSTNSFAFNVDNNDSWDKFVDNLSDLYQLEDLGETGSRKTTLAATMNVAAQYTLPVYRKAKFGLLNTTCFNGPFTWTEFRLSANVEPVKVLSFGANVGMGTFGFSFGWIVNLKAPGFNLFVASDHTPGKLAKQGVPLNSNMNLNMGINFPF
ncbi:MAG: DUF5723 family protein [Clostridium sp.]|nr:DUF5723 family protein [Clostridium sp.]